MSQPLGSRPAAFLAPAWALLLCFTAGSGPRVVQADAPPTFAELTAAYEAGDKRNDVETQATLLPRLCRVAAEATYDEKDDAGRRRVWGDRRQARSLCRKAIVHPRRALILAGLEGYGILALPGSSDDLKNHAGRQAGERRPHAVRLAAIGAWGRIHDPGSHLLLIDHLRLPSRQPEAAELALAAVEALQHFRHVPRGLKRFELLRDVMLLFEALRNASGINTGFVVSADSTHWYALQEARLVVLFNVLTEQGVLSYPAALSWWRANRHAVKAGQR